MDSTHTRRHLLAATAAGGAVAISGCLGTRERSVPEPVVADDRIDEGWDLVDESSAKAFEDSYGPVTVRALQQSRVYAYASVAEAVAEAFDADGSPVLFFSTRIDLRPAVDGLPFGVGRDRVMNQVEEATEGAFRDQLRSGGIDDVEVADTSTLDVETGHTATSFTFVGRFIADGELDVGGGNTEPVDDELDIEARLAIWHDGTDVLLSGGSYPTEPIDVVFEDVLEDAPVELGDVVEEDTAETLSQDPETYEGEVDSLMTSVE